MEGLNTMDELYVMARRVLLDALDALGSHRDALVLVGAQAVYLRVGEGDIAVAPFTTDGDLAIDPAVLKEIPPIEQALLAAGFAPKTKDSVGIWITRRTTALKVAREIAVDLLVPQTFSATRSGQRAARLEGHDFRTARVVEGLDGVLVDADVMSLTSLESSDARAFDLRVAGPAALLVAKVHKIRDRQNTGRESDKDALDVLRILRGLATDELVERYRKLLGHERSLGAATAGLQLLKTQFATRSSTGVLMAVKAAGVLANADELAASCEALTGDLLSAMGAV